MKVTSFALATVLALCGMTIRPGEAAKMNHADRVAYDDERNDQGGGNPNHKRTAVMEVPSAIEGATHLRKGDIGMVAESPFSSLSDKSALNKLVNGMNFEEYSKNDATIAMKIQPDVKGGVRDEEIDNGGIGGVTVEGLDSGPSNKMNPIKLVDEESEGYIQSQGSNEFDRDPSFFEKVAMMGSHESASLVLVRRL